VILAGLIMRFGKYAGVAESKYDIVVIFPNVAGIVKEASVMYAGLPVGIVKDINLSEDNGLNVRLTLSIYRQYTIRKDAKFVIEQSGLLGDRYIDIVPQSITAPPIQPGDVLQGTTSVDLSEAIRNVVDVLHQAAGTIARVDSALKRVDEMVLNTQSLMHVSQTFANVDAASSNAVALTVSLRSVVDAGQQDLTNAFAKLSLASDNMSSASKRVEQVVADNQDDVRAAVKNLADSTQRLDTILTRLQQGQGTVGKLLVDPTLHNDLVHLIENWRRYGLLYKEGRQLHDTGTQSGGTPQTNFKP
jgi:phospholipid/cholesterol/gamma-HCH transport system substrate-binding protein